jgi:hypothetical protein
VSQRHPQGRDGQRSSERVIQVPPNHPARVSIQNHRQVDELLLQPDVRDIRYPQLIDAGEDHRGRPIRIDLESVRRVGRHHELPFHHAQQIVFLHQPLHPLAIDFPSAVPQFLPDPPASIAGPLQGDLLHLIAQL